jgi:N-acetylmuramoyl-L-alanine amidase
VGIVILDRQHAGHPSKTSDLGAWGDLDHNGHGSLWEQEAVLSAQYGLATEVRLRELGHAVIPVSDGRYSDRHLRANAYAKAATGQRCAYVALHVNAGGGAYGLVLSDARSKSGPALATAVAAKLRAALPELASVKTFGAGSTGDWVHAYNTIAGVYSGRAVGICFEPCFLDGPHATELLSTTGLQRIGYALADGLHAWLS